MAIVAKSTGGATGNKYLHPEGQFAAVCIDVIDLGMVKSTFNNKVKNQHKIVIRFWAGEYNEEGEALFAGERFTLSLWDRAALRPFLETWRGKKFTEPEPEFDVESMIGVPAFIQVMHSESNGKTYANVATAMPLPKGLGGIQPLASYVRVCNRPKDDNGKTDKPGPSTPRSFNPDADDDDLPF